MVSEPLERDDVDPTTHRDAADSQFFCLRMNQNITIMNHMNESKGKLPIIDAGKRLISLNLIYDYPVRWSPYVVLRDFVQNFYDSLGWRDWSRLFEYTCSDGSLTLKARNVGFSYEWLVHIGASTKRDTGGVHAGYFGEGFKMAALCAVRDHGWGVHIASQEWEMEVTSTDLLIENRVLKSLAYSLSDRSGPDTASTMLRISNFHDHDVFQSVLLGFYYPENPLLGEEIWRSEKGAVYKRSRLRKPPKFPETSRFEGPGILFASFQARGSIPVPLIFCLHNYRDHDRDRDVFYRMNAISLIASVVTDMSAPAAARVLRELRRFWRSARGNYTFDSWWSIIQNIVLKISTNSRTTSLWLSEFPFLLTVSDFKRSNLVAANRRSQALSWMQKQPEPYRLVQESFRHLGYPSLEEVCQKAGGFTDHRPPQGDEIVRLELLVRCVGALFPELEERRLPDIRVFDNNATAFWGLAVCKPARKPFESLLGYPVRYVLSEISINATLLQSGDFPEILSTFLHEVAHMFGRDESASFSRVLTYLLEVAIRERETVARFHKEWHRYVDSSGHRFP